MCAYQSTEGLKFGYSLKQQNAYGTALATCEASHDSNTDDIFQFPPNKWNNAKNYGKGHKWATKRKTLSQDAKLSQTFQASSWILGYELALALGYVETTQPNPVESPNVYQHLFKITPSKQLPVTTIWQQLFDGKQITVRDCLLQAFTLSGKKDEHLQLQHSIIGSGHYAASSISIPELVATSFLLAHDVQFKYNTQDISARINDFTFQFQNALKEKEGYCMGSPVFTTQNGKKIAVRSMLLKSEESADLKFKMLYYDDAFETDNLENIERNITLTAVGDPIDTHYNHELKIEVNKAVLETANLGKDGDMYVYDCAVGFNWDETAEGPFTITLTNDVPQYLALPS